MGANVRVVTYDDSMQDLGIVVYLIAMPEYGTIDDTFCANLVVLPQHTRTNLTASPDDAMGSDDGGTGDDDVFTDDYTIAEYHGAVNLGTVGN